ncbi:hypothetical protein ENSA5_47280 [Enhygromyxa salina]|uniref:NHL repeat protein n=1 Tax=Enhygromyxa salina TaxID=215803 RepID=A0A2S9XIW3_9BACT|nr:hypothetical protein [Enhygromyxa salina]PRP92815.1 hypothetical protein ENSA5_47280 [Enhygromyxa salina]
MGARSQHAARALGSLVLSLISACTDPGGALDTDSEASTSTDSDDTTGGVTYDCANLPGPWIRQLDGPIAAADVAFDDQGNLVGSNTQDLFKTSSADGQPALWVPGAAGRAAVRQLSDGRIAVVQEMFFRVLVFSPDGSSAVLASNLVYPFGLVEDLDGNIYIGDETRIVRVDAESGETEVWLDAPGFVSRWVSFDRDYDALFVGGRSEVIYRVPLGPGGEAGEPIEWGTLPLFGDPGPAPPPNQGGGAGTKTDGEGPDESNERLALVDGLGVDACGNLYVAEFHSRGLYKIPAGGGAGELFVGWEPFRYGHGLQWGSGIGDWSATSLYLPQPYNEFNVIEVEVGVPQKQQP